MTQDVIFPALQKMLPRVRRNVPKSAHTTFRIGGPAEFFCVAKNEKELLRAFRAAKKLKLPVLVLGGGSNLLVADRGVKGLVVKIQSSSIKLKSRNVIQADAGVLMGKLVSFSVNHGLQGVEWAGGLPGTVGGAVRGNAGAFGGEMKDVVDKVRVIDDKLRLRTFTHGQCQFAYRTSVFKKRGWVVVWVQIKCAQGDKRLLKEVAQRRIAYRNEKHPLEYPSAGSVFKNVPVADLSHKFQKEFADKVKQDPFPIVPAAWLIIGAGLTGMRVGGAEISTKHSNYIVNKNHATAQDVKMLIELVQDRVKKKYGVELEAEVQLVGF